MASSCDTFSSRWPGESLQQREAVTLRQKQSQNFTVCNRKMHKWKPKYQNGLVSRSTNQQDKCIQWYLLRFIKRVFSSPARTLPVISYRVNFSICLIGCGAVCHRGSLRAQDIVPAAFDETSNTQRSIYGNCYAWQADPFWVSIVIRLQLYIMTTPYRARHKRLPGDVKSPIMLLKERTWNYHQMVWV